MATSFPRRGTRVTRLAAALVVALAFTACADDDPETAPTDSSAPQEVTSSDVDVDVDVDVDSDEVDSDEEGTADESGVSESSTDAGDETADSTSDQPSAEQDDSDAGSAITTTPPPTQATGDDSSTAVDDTIAPVPVPVPGPTVVSELEDEADFGTGVSASITDIEAVDVEGRAPGERSGPGLLVTVEVENDSDEPISLDFVTVDLIRADGASAIPVDTPEQTPLAGDLEPGARATGTYQFFIRPEDRSSATITVNYASGEPTALFSGDLPDA